MKQPTIKQAKLHLGFTLVEVVVAVFILGIIVMVTASGFIYFLRGVDFSIEQGQTVSIARSGLTLFTQAARTARISQDGAYPLVVTQDNEFAFYSDIDNDNSIERIRYYLDGSTLYQSITEPGSAPNLYSGSESTKEVAGFVVNGSEPLFYYYNQDWPGDTANNPLALNRRLLETRVVEIRLRINTDPSAQEDVELSTVVMLRNLKTN